MVETRQSRTRPAERKAPVKVASTAEAVAESKIVEGEPVQDEAVNPVAPAPDESVACPDPAEPAIEVAAELAESAILETETVADRLLDSSLRGVAEHLDFLSALAAAATPFDALAALEDYRARALGHAIEDGHALAEASLRLATGRLAA